MAPVSESDRPSFEPVLLDLVDDLDYQVLIQALEEYEGVMECEVDSELHRVINNQNPEMASQADSLQSVANRARRIRLDIERQLEANDAARKNPYPGPAQTERSDS